MKPNKERAKQVILELLRQAGGEMGKTKLFKAFWFAHLYYFKKSASYLSDWPIVRMPNGPGIDNAALLLGELVATGNVTLTHEPRGPFVEMTCRVTDKPLPGELPRDAIAAIREAVEFVKPLSAEALSELSHEFSRSWNTKPDGAELNIYTDLIPDDVYEEGWKELHQMKKDYEELFE